MAEAAVVADNTVGWHSARQEAHGISDGGGIKGVECSEHFLQFFFFLINRHESL